MKNIIFLLSGQSRNNSLSDNFNSDERILKSFNDYVFTNELKKKFNYKVFVSSDNINVDKFINFFGLPYIGNIHLFDNDYYYFNISSNIKPIKYYLDKYDEEDWSYYAKHTNGIRQYYKLLDCYNLFRNDKSFNNADYIVRLRLDYVFTENILNIINFLEKNKETDILMQWDFFAIGRPKIMNVYCTALENKFGTYNFNADLSDLNKLNICPDYKTMNEKKGRQWRYAAEVQLFETLFEYCNKNNYNINTKIKKITPGNIYKRYIKETKKIEQFNNSNKKNKYIIYILLLICLIYLFLIILKQLNN